MEANPLAIGYASLSAVGDTVKMVTVGGVECSEAVSYTHLDVYKRQSLMWSNPTVPLPSRA